MKKTLFLISAILFTTMNVFGETEFTRALLNCNSYTKEGSIPYEGQIFNLKITLQKSKGNKCTYKERIYQDIGYEELVCNFDKQQSQNIANYMSEFSEKYKAEIAKNRIFEAKLSTNPVVFQKYLVEPQLCKINYQKKK